MKRLIRGAADEPRRPTPGEVVPATADPVLPQIDDRPTAPVQRVAGTPEPYMEPTVAQPAAAVYEQPAPVAYVDPYVVQPAVVPVAEPAVVYSQVPPDRSYGWVGMAAAIALLLGGLAGFFIGRASDDGDKTAITGGTDAPTDSVSDALVDQRVTDIFDTLLAQAQQAGSVQPTQYPQLDALLAMAAADGGRPAEAQAQIDTLTAERDQSLLQATEFQQQVATLQEALTAAETERDDLRATIEQNGGTTSDLQTQLDAQALEITALQTELDSTRAALDNANTDLVKARTDLDKANADLAKAKSDLQSVQTALDSANATLQQLNVKQVENFVGTDIVKVRTQAKANGWTLVERQVDDPVAVPGTVTAQAPAPGSNMITGSVLYVEVARKVGG